MDKYQDSIFSNVVSGYSFLDSNENVDFSKLNKDLVASTISWVRIPNLLSLDKEIDLYNSLKPIFPNIIISVPLGPLNTFETRFLQKIDQLPESTVLIETHNTSGLILDGLESILQFLQQHKSTKRVGVSLNKRLTPFFESTIWDFYFLEIDFTVASLLKYPETVFPFLNTTGKPVIGFGPAEAVSLEKYYKPSLYYPRIYLDKYCGTSLIFENDLQYELFKSTEFDLDLLVKTEKKTELDLVAASIRSRYKLGLPDVSCFYCEACNNACPLSLYPQEMMYYFKNGRSFGTYKDKIIKTGMECTLCNVCNDVCPIHVPLAIYLQSPVHLAGD